MGLGDEHQRGEVPFLPHRLRLPRLTWFVAVDVGLGPPAEVVGVCFVHLKLPLLHTIPYFSEEAAVSRS